MPDTIILHMSDLHFSSNEEKKREKDVIMNSLVDALKNYRIRHLTPPTCTLLSLIIFKIRLFLKFITVLLYCNLFESVWQNIDSCATCYVIENYIERAEGKRSFCSFCSVLFLACFRLFPSLAQYLYDNHCIPNAVTKPLLNFL